MDKVLLALLQYQPEPPVCIACMVQAERPGGQGEAEWRAQEQHPGPQLRGHQESGVLHQQLRGGQRSRPARTRSRLQAGGREAAAVLRDEDQGVPIVHINLRPTRYFLMIN